MREPFCMLCPRRSRSRRGTLGSWWHLSSEWRKWCLHGRGSDLVVRECQKRSTLACTTRDQFQRHRSLPPRRAAPPWDKEARHSHAGLHRGKGKGKAERQRQRCGLQRAAARRTTALPPPCTSIQRRQSGVGGTQHQAPVRSSYYRHRALVARASHERRTLTRRCPNTRLSACRRSTSTSTTAARSATAARATWDGSRSRSWSSHAPLVRPR